MKNRLMSILAIGLGCLLIASAHPRPASAATSVEVAAGEIQRKLDDAIAELDALRQQIADEKIPLSRRLSELESELIDVRLEYQQATRRRDRASLDLTNLQSEIDARRDEAAYLSNLLGEYIRNFESRLHIAEFPQYREQLDIASSAPEDPNLADQEIYETQIAMVRRSLERLQDLAGGTRFDGTAVDTGGLVRSGMFALVGPAAVFRSSDGQHVGSVEQRLGSLEPAIIPYVDPAVAQTAAQVVEGTDDMFPLDPTLGNAQIIESTKETLWEHVQAGGPVMVPIFALAAAAFLVAIYKWIVLAFVRSPSRRRVKALLDAIARCDDETARREVRAIRGPAGRMLQAGVEHLGEPRELIEEVMYERVLSTRLKVQRLLPFIAISAAAAPLLGLLGTVTGIINTFKLITVFGTGDVKTLSGGISEALITTEFGLIVAIPSLLLHAFLSRRARGVVDQMEKAAVALMNEVVKSGRARTTAPAAAEIRAAPPSPASSAGAASPAAGVDTDSEGRGAPTAAEIKDILSDLLTPVVQANLQAGHRARNHADAPRPEPVAASATDEHD